MNTKLLKQKILDLAIRGKLTDQRKNDGTARDLLTQISDERRKTRDERIGMSSKKSGVILSEAQSAKSKDLGQIIPLDKNEAPFEIPENWEWVRLGDVISIKSGDAIKVRNNQVGEFPVYGGNGVTGYCDSFNIEKRTIVIGRVGFNCGSVHVSKGKAWVTDNAFITKFNDLIYDISFLEKLLIYFELRRFSNSTAQPVISGKTIYPIPIPLPPIAEQQRIVAKIEEAFAEIDAIEKNKELLKTHIKQTRQKILDLAIHGKLVPQDKNDEPASVLLERITRDNPHYEKIENEPFEIPENWAWCKLGNLFFHTTGKALKKANSTGIQRNYITTSNLYWGEFDLSEVRSMYFTEDELDKCTAKKGDLLLCNGGDVGRAAIWNFDYDICFQNHISRLRPKSVSLSNVFYLYVIRYNKEKGNLNGRGVGITSLSANDLLSLVVPLPPLNEQSRIVAKIEELFSTLDQMERNLV